MADAPALPPLVAILGPTAAGKTRLALDLAEAVGGEIVVADSVQAYRGLDVGSAKPTAAERLRVRHHALDLVDVAEPLDAGRWLSVAEPAIRDVAARGKIPLVVGGTGLYVRALVLGLADVPPVDPATRAEVRAWVAAVGAPAAHAELARVDPASAARIASGDPQRIGRALEVLRATGRALSAWIADRPQGAPRVAATIVALVPEPARLDDRIARRAREMVARGLVDEVRALLAAGVPADAPGLRTLGYREVVAAIGAGPIDAEVLAAAVARAHRQYAKRQLTWIRGSGMAGLALRVLDPDDAATPSALVAIVDAARAAPVAGDADRT